MYPGHCKPSVYIYKYTDIIPNFNEKFDEFIDNPHPHASYF